MNKSIYNFWLNIEPLRSKWILPLVILTFLLLIFYFFGHTDDMDIVMSLKNGSIINKVTIVD